jgi:hypothetical protein
MVEVSLNWTLPGTNLPREDQSDLIKEAPIIGPRLQSEQSAVQAAVVTLRAQSTLPVTQGVSRARQYAASSWYNSNLMSVLF